jgi:hypothetical protein
MAPVDASSAAAPGRDRGTPRLGIISHFEPLRALPRSYSGSGDLVRALEGTRGEPKLRPLSLANGDFDRDGVPDIVAGYGRGESGVLVLYRGNPDSIYPNAPEARARRQGSPGDENPFLMPGIVSGSPTRPDLLQAGDFDADGAIDLAVASTGKSAVEILPGDGAGGFRAPRQILLPGALTAMAAGEINRADGRTDLVIGVTGPSRSQLLLYQSYEGAASASPDAIDIPAGPSSILLGRWDEDAFFDVTAITGRNLIVVHGRDGLVAAHGAQTSYRVARATFPSRIAGAATGDFDADLQTDIALLFEDGSVRHASFGAVLQAVREGAAPAGVMQRVLGADLASLGMVARDVRLEAAKVSSGPGTNLLLVDSSSGRVRVMASPMRSSASHVAGETDVELDLGTVAPKVVLPMRLNADALADLVILSAAGIESASGATLAVAMTAPAAVYTVTNTADGGPGSLRSAIEQANLSPGADLITFNILPAGAKTIQPATPLPSIFEAVTIDGTTQPGFTGTPIIELDGSAAGSADGLDLYDGSVIRSLAINRWVLAIYTSPSSAHVIEGNYIGVDFTGTAARPNSYGVHLTNGNTLGGTTLAARNVVSGNLGQGIVIYGSDNVIKSNFIGTQSSGSAPLGNFTGIKIWDGSNNQIGGLYGQNLISGNSSTGIEIGPGGPGGNRIEDNLIGTDLNCSVALANGLRGIEINASAVNNIVANTISGNAAEGVLIANAGANWNAIFANQIGISCFDAPLGNGKNGVRIVDGADNRVGLGPYGSNRIAYNGEPGVFVASGTGNEIRANSIFGNGGLGIDLGPGTFSNGVTLNDPGDSDADANGLQNFPNLVTASACVSTTKILTSLGSLPSSSYRLGFFYNPSCDPSGWGEGQYLLPLEPTVVTGGSGGVTLEVYQPAFVPGGSFLTATATDASGNTSEFSGCLEVIDVTPPGEATNLVWQPGSKTSLSWQPVSGATTYRLHRGVRADLPKLLTSSTDACWRFTTQTTSTGAVLPETPPPGSMFWYLVRPVISYCEGPAGNASAGPRVQNSGLLCPDSQSCLHSHCDIGVPLAPTCDPCVAAACAIDSYCCTTQWDSVCVGEVRTICGSLACPASQGTCSHPVCGAGAALAAGCDDPPTPSCAGRICSDTPTCCTTGWDAGCVEKVTSICGQGCY